MRRFGYARSVGTEVIGVVRGATTLHALSHEVGEPTDTDAPWRREQRCVLRPVETGPLADAWRALAAVSVWDATTRAHVSRVLSESVPSGDAPGELPVLEEPVAPPRATAAHPRGFRGTKYQPPKPRQAGPVDVRPYLLTRRHTELVLARLDAAMPADGFEPGLAMLPMLRGKAELATIARALELHTRPELRAAMIGIGDAPGWWSHVLAHDPEQRLEVAQLVSASGVATLPAFEPELAARIARLSGEQQWAIYQGLREGASSAYIGAGISLEAIDWQKVPPGRVDVTALVEQVVSRLALGHGSWLWRLCGEYPVMIELLESDAFAALAPAAAGWLLWIAARVGWEEVYPPECRALILDLPRFAERARRVTAAYQQKLVKDLCLIHLWASLNDADIEATLVACSEICVRLAAPPFSTESRLASVYPLIVDVRAVVAAPDASWIALEEACKRFNQERLVMAGLDCLAEVAPELLSTTFSTSPGALVQTAGSLAALSFPEAATLLAPLATPIPARSLAELCDFIAPIAAAGGPNPIRRALREHLDGTRLLSDEQLRGHHERIVAELGVVRLAAVRQAVDRVLAARIGSAQVAPPMRHALSMLHRVRANRRPLTRMLEAIAAGDASWRRRHPRSQEWLARHPALDVELWTTGIELRGELPDIGEVRLAIEQDPLEALKLGTYVGTCLGQGGAYEHGAAAAALDLNKQVVYARDARGAVVARQLLAISEADQLVCFEVYGSRAANTLFRAFDRAFADRLGLPISDGTYTIATLLSQTWVDDGAWLDD